MYINHTDIRRVSMVTHVWVTCTAGLTAKGPLAGMAHYICTGINGDVPLIKKGWLQHFLSSIIVLSRDGMLLPLLPDLARKVKFFSKMAL